MSNRIVCDVAISADGYVAGPGQTAEKPFGDGPVDRLQAWMFDTPDENRAELDEIVSAGAFVDELRTHVTPVTLGAGERLFDGVPPLNLELLAVRAASLVTHIRYRVLR
jgi:hypothetical protein